MMLLARGPVVDSVLLSKEELEVVYKWMKEKYPRSTPVVQRFKGLGEMNPQQLRETTIDPDTRRLVQLSIGDCTETHEIFDKLLAKKRSTDRKFWLEIKGDLATVD